MIGSGSQCSITNVIACEFCDLYHEHPVLWAGQKARCSRCGGLLAKVARSPIEGTLALTLTAAMLLVLANVFPFLRLSLEGQVQENTIATGVVAATRSDARSGPPRRRVRGGPRTDRRPPRRRVGRAAAVL